MCDVAEVMVRAAGGGESYDSLLLDSDVSFGDVDIDTDEETNVVDLAAFVGRAGQVIR